MWITSALFQLNLSVFHSLWIYSCRQCKKDHDREQISHAVMIKAKGAPEPLIKGSMVSPSLFAHTVCEKFVKAVPFYRQEKDW